MKKSSKIGILILVMLLAVLPLLAACGDDDEKETPSPTATKPTATATGKPTPTETEQQKVKINIGLLTDLTGPSATALVPVDQALKDVIRYFNEKNLIPGAEFEAISYDTGYDPAKVRPGYEWLKERKAAFFFSGVPLAGTLTKPWVDQDKIIFFSLVSSPELYAPPGYTFSVNIDTEAFVYTLMNWLPQNDPNFPKGRPAKIGLVGMEEPYVKNMLEGVEKWCATHPSEWRMVGGFTVPWTQVNFPTEVEALKGCDYVLPPSTGFFLANFVKQMRAAGYAGNFLGTDAQMAFLGQMVDWAGWDSFNGMFFGLPYTWWSEDSETCKIAKYALEAYHTAGEQKELKWSGGSYRGGFTQSYGMMTILKKTIERVGVTNFSPQALYDTCVQFSEEFDGNLWDYSSTDRTSWNNLNIFQADASVTDVHKRASLVPVIFHP